MLWQSYHVHFAVRIIESQMTNLYKLCMDFNLILLYCVSRGEK